jgi:hypothetical protein
MIKEFAKGYSLLTHSGLREVSGYYIHVSFHPCINTDMQILYRNVENGLYGISIIVKTHRPVLLLHKQCKSL